MTPTALAGILPNMTDSQSATEPTRSSKREARKQQLLGAARKLFLARGFAQTSVSAIVAEAGVAQGTFYLYFKSKQSVLPHLRVEVLGAYLRAWARAMERSEGQPSDARLVEGLRAVADAVAANRDLTRLFREATAPVEQQKVWLAGRRQLSEPLGKLIEAGQRDGSLRSDDPNIAAQLALSLLDDLLYEALEYQSPAPLEATFIYGTRFLLRALRCDEGRVEALAPMSDVRKSEAS